MIIYTCITNKYCSLPEVMPDGADYICFGDADEVGPWKVYPTVDCGDPVRTSRYHKINCPFDGDSVYVDGSKVHLLNDQFLELSKEILSKKHFFVMQHPHEYSYLEECAEYVQNGWVDEQTLYRYSCEAKNLGYDFGKHFSPLCTILWRKAGMQRFNEEWWKWYERGGVRDQLSFSTALQMTGIIFEKLPSVSVINRFSDASPDGVWWRNRQGDYKYYESKDPLYTVNLLSSVTGLSLLRYRTLDVVLKDEDLNYYTKRMIGRVSGYTWVDGDLKLTTSKSVKFQ